MSNYKQSSVEWLFERLWGTPKDKFTWYALLEQGKAMHEEEIEDAWDKGDYCIDLPDGTWEQKYKSAKHYYNETFGGNNESKN